MIIFAFSGGTDDSRPPAPVVLQRRSARGGDRAWQRRFL